MGCASSTEEQQHAAAGGAEAAPATSEFHWEEDEKDKPEIASTAKKAEMEEDKRKSMTRGLKKQRASISAECFEMGKEAKPKQVVPKSVAQKELVRSVIDKALLLQRLDDEQKEDVLNACRLVTFASGVEIITQGDNTAEDFYMLADGACEAYVNNVKVMSYAKGGCFGELALMYNAPRAATVRATANCQCYALDRQTFRALVIESNAKRTMAYEQFLCDVDLLDTLSADDRAAIADALKPLTFQNGDVIIKEGTPGSIFYLLEQGEVVATTSRDAGFKKVYKRGDYFGEMALLSNGVGARQATCIAQGTVRAATMTKDSFTRLLGSMETEMKAAAKQYEGH